MTRFQKSFRAVFVCLLIGGLAACGKAPVGSASGCSGPEPEYVVGTDAHYAPFEDVDPSSRIRGFDVDLLNAIAAKSCFKVKFVDTPWDRLFASLQQGNLAILASSISITPDRLKMMDFSDPYFLSRQMIVVGKHEEDIRSFNDIVDKRVAVQTDTTGDVFVQTLLGKDNPRIHRFVSMSGALLSLESGEVDAVVGDSGLVTHYVKTHRQSGVYAMQDTGQAAPEYYGFAVRKGNQALLEQINRGLAEVKKNGSYDTLYRLYFGPGG
jgi:polar amino acid transport system substrate-binding protein